MAPAGGAGAGETGWTDGHACTPRTYLWLASPPKRPRMQAQSSGHHRGYRTWIQPTRSHSHTRCHWCTARARNPASGASQSRAAGSLLCNPTSQHAAPVGTTVHYTVFRSKTGRRYTCPLVRGHADCAQRHVRHASHAARYQKVLLTNATYHAELPASTPNVATAATNATNVTKRTARSRRTIGAMVWRVCKPILSPCGARERSPLMDSHGVNTQAAL